MSLLVNCTLKSSILSSVSGFKNWRCLPPPISVFKNWQNIRLPPFQSIKLGRMFIHSYFSANVLYRASESATVWYFLLQPKDHTTLSLPLYLYISCMPTVLSLVCLGGFSSGTVLSLYPHQAIKDCYIHHPINFPLPLGQGYSNEVVTIINIVDYFIQQRKYAFIKRLYDAL